MRSQICSDERKGGAFDLVDVPIHLRGVDCKRIDPITGTGGGLEMRVAGVFLRDAKHPEGSLWWNNVKKRTEETLKKRIHLIWSSFISS